MTWKIGIENLLVNKDYIYHSIISQMKLLQKGALLE